MFCLFPVNRLSTHSTSLPRSMSRSHRCEPRKPAPPVTMIVSFIEYPDLDDWRASFEQPGRVPRVDLPGFDVFRGHSGKPEHCAVAERYARKHAGPRANPGVRAE